MNDIQASDIREICSRIELQTVASSSVRAVGYDKDESILLIDYYDDSQLAYIEVDRFHHRNIMHTSETYKCGVGRYLREKVYGNYSCVCIRYPANDWRRIVSDFIGQIEMPGTVYEDKNGHDLRNNARYIALRKLLPPERAETA